MDSLVARLEAVCAKLGGGGDDDGEGEAPAVAAYNAFYSAHVQAFVDAANKFDETKKIGAWAERAFKHLGVIVEMNTVCKKPADDKWGDVFGDMGAVVGEAGNPDMRCPTANQEKSFAEALACLNWIVDPLPRPIVQGALESADFYLVKCLTACKDLPDPEKTDRRAFVNTMKNMLKELATFVVAFYKTGLAWKVSGIEISAFKPGETSTAGGGGGGASSAEARVEKCIEALEAHAAKMAGGDDGDTPAFVTAWKDLMASHLKPFVETCTKIEEAKAVGEWAQKAWDGTSKVVDAAAVCAKPSDADFGAFVKDISDVIGASSNPDNRNKKQFPFEKSFGEGVTSLSWIMVPGPKQHVTGALEAADFYLNKCLTVARDEEDPRKTDMRAFVKQFKALLAEMASYCGEFHKMGLGWKNGGTDVKDFK